jgi:hypothetical protein
MARSAGLATPKLQRRGRLLLRIPITTAVMKSSTRSNIKGTHRARRCDGLDPDGTAHDGSWSCVAGMSLADPILTVPQSSYTQMTSQPCRRI